ncbi:N-acetylmuramoyl-L-alanine amidase [Psychrobacillus sp. FSL K6-2365]|uniref:peptidoglycan recognition protein family protein n=1 Tax=Psychrobacillus sp. FSL K6-2365 TaxID=2921546 RepID=UPI0030F707D5
MKLLQHGSKIGNATVIVDIIGTGNPEIRPQTKMNPKKVTTHNTGNSGRGADAEMHNRYIHNLASYHPKDTSHVSWHLTVDDKFIYQHIPFDEAAYHCGDGWGVNSGNRTSIGIEICENPETNTQKAEENAIALTVLLLKEFKLNVNDVHPHQHWSGKYCPRVILKRDGSFNLYRKRIENVINKKGVAGVSEQKLNADQTKLLAEAKRLKLTDGKEPFGEVNRLYLFSVIVGLAQQVEELNKKVK